MSKSVSSLTSVFLDRDGVINRKLPEGEYVRSWQQFDLLPGVSEAIAQLNQAGLIVVVVTNQRGIALGLYSPEDVRAIHTNLDRVLAEAGAKIDGYYFCPHDKLQCACRKPLSGLFRQAQEDFPEIRPETSVVLGDSLSDIQFGRNLGLTTIFIEGEQGKQKPGASIASTFADETFVNLPRAVESLLEGLKTAPDRDTRIGET